MKFSEDLNVSEMFKFAHEDFKHCCQTYRTSEPAGQVNGLRIVFLINLIVIDLLSDFRGIGREK